MLPLVWGPHFEKLDSKVDIWNKVRGPCPITPGAEVDSEAQRGPMAHERASRGLFTGSPRPR